MWDGSLGNHYVVYVRTITLKDCYAEDILQKCNKLAKGQSISNTTENDILWWKADMKAAKREYIQKGSLQYTADQ